MLSCNISLELEEKLLLLSEFKVKHFEIIQIPLKQFLNWNKILK